MDMMKAAVTLRNGRLASTCPHRGATSPRDRLSACRMTMSAPSARSLSITSPASGTDGPVFRSQAERQRSLLAEVKGAVTGELCEHIVSARVDGESLIVAIDSRVWCSVLRWSTHVLHGVARRHHAAYIRVTVLPAGRPL